MKNRELYSLNNFDFLARSFARMSMQGRSVDLRAITGNMDKEHRDWFCRRYALYCRQLRPTAAPASELEH